MAKVGKKQSNEKRRKLAQQHAEKRKRLKAAARDMSSPPEERFAARLKLAELPRNSAQVRVRNRCEVTGRPRGYYRAQGRRSQGQSHGGGARIWCSGFDGCF